MKKNLFWAASIACLCASCANDAVIEENRASDEIRFRAFAEGSTRAADVYCPSNKPEEFYVYAKDAAGNLIINGDHIKDNGSGTYENLTEKRYWPETGSLTFEALINGTNEDGKVNFTVADAAANQLDLVYARKTASKAAGEVNLNFRHALSQIVFKAKNTNKTLTVEIAEVVLGNVNNTGVYTLPTEEDGDTSGSITESDGHIGCSYQTAGRGKWEDLSGTANYTVTLAEAIKLEGETAATDISGANSTAALMLIPGETAAWNGTTAIITDKTSPDYNLNTLSGGFFLLKVKISQVVNANTETAAYIWGSANQYKYLAIPVSFNWEEGKRYVYTFAFGQGNGGVDPTNPDDNVFVPITFSVDVDEFVPASEDVNVGGAGKTAGSTESAEPAE